MKYLKTYNIRTNDYVYHVTIDEHSSFTMEFPYSSISGTYGATFLNIEICTLRGLLRKIPNFVEEFSWCDIDKSLVEFGFEKQIEATKLQASLYLNEDIQVQ